MIDKESDHPSGQAFIVMGAPTNCCLLKPADLDHERDISPLQFFKECMNGLVARISGLHGVEPHIPLNNATLDSYIGRYSRVTFRLHPISSSFQTITSLEMILFSH